MSNIKQASNNLIIPQTQGPFSFVVSDKTIKLNENSYIFSDISNIYDYIPIDYSSELSLESTKYIWLELQFRNGSYLSPAKIKGGENLWDGAPLIWEFDTGKAPSPTTQTKLYIRLATIEKNFCSGHGVFYPNESESEDSYEIIRHVFSDLVLFQTCAGYIFLPSPSSRYNSFSYNGEE